ncbi:MAG: hypothetical protein VX574_02895 [Myxococcota bacterium]|nr:hypothetical protein [Myxococcota bacterium]
MSRSPAGALGIDLGASRTKIAWRPAGGALRLEAFARGEDSAVEERAGTAAEGPIGVTGAGASAFAGTFKGGEPLEIVGEFEAWARGSRVLLERAELAIPDPFLLVSLGTGTSMLRVEGGTTTRIGGTALGGGTLVGLASRLCDCRDFDELCRMAVRGERHRADLVVADIYPGEDRPLPGDVTAASLEKLGRFALNDDEAPGCDDIAAALMGLVGENVAQLASALAAAGQLSTIVYGGSALRENPALTNLLVAIPSLQGRRATILPSGEYAGAVGALEAATD